VVWPSPSRHGRPDLGLPVAANRRSVGAVTRPSLRFGITSASLRAKKSTHRRTCHIDKTCVCRPASSLNPETAGSAAENHTGIAGSQVLSRSGLPRPVSPDQLCRSPDRWLRYPLPAGSVSRTSRTTPSAMRQASSPSLSWSSPSIARLYSCHGYSKSTLSGHPSLRWMIFQAPKQTAVVSSGS
jgi:hypothetical protein